jgi:hypothetical protein
VYQKVLYIGLVKLKNNIVMTQEEKQLLLKDLCARLPYNVKIEANVCPRTLFPMDVVMENLPKPYLRQMSSMTEDEKRELSKKYVWDINCGQIEIRYHSEGYWDDNIECPTSEYLNLFDWLNAHHFDYRGLIEKGLALEAPKDMYEI